MNTDPMTLKDDLKRILWSAMQPSHNQIPEEQDRSNPAESVQNIPYQSKRGSQVPEDDVIERIEPNRKQVGPAKNDSDEAVVGERRQNE